MPRLGLTRRAEPRLQAILTTSNLPNFGRQSPTPTILPGTKQLHAIDRRGRPVVFDNLIFHGGGDTALEMRLFSRFAPLWHLGAAGFGRFKIYSRPLFDIGYYWPPIPITQSHISGNYLGYIIAARA